MYQNMLHYKPASLVSVASPTREELFTSTEETAVLHYDQEHDYFELTLKGIIDDKSFKKVHRTLFQTLDDKPGRKIIFNFKHVNRTDILSRAWYSSVFITSLFRQHGMKFNVGVVKPKNLFESKNIEIMFRSNLTAGQKGELRFFSDLFDAQRWITI